ncbi:MAG: Fe-S protein assembly co-chaperone HscB [Alphaproteobacteria bacterium]|nr:Fe-S protein assembly co-chaperone HscB [Alphaproteobacteria bacterium]
MTNYFTLLGIAESFDLDIKTLEKSYFDIQRAAHPDRQIGKSEAERIVAIERSMDANQAYEALKNPLTRAEHLLALKGVHVNSEADTVKPSQALLVEMMELREQISDSSEDGRKLLELVSDIRKSADESVDAIAEALSANDLEHAAQYTIRLHYLGKAAEEAHMYLYRIKAQHAHTHESH